MNKRVAILLADGFEEIEALSVVDILRRSNIAIDMISIKEEYVNGSHNILVKSDKLISDVNSNDYDMIVCPGGHVGSVNLTNSNEVIELIKDFNSKNKFICFICAVPMILEKAGLESGKNITSYPDDYYKNILKNSNYVDNGLVVVDNNIVTSRGPATSFEFAYTLVDLLGGNSNQLKEGMLYNYLFNNK